MEMIDYNDFFEQILILLLSNESKKTISVEGLKNIKNMNYNNNNNNMNYKQCAISLEDFQEGEKISQLPCKHIFKTEQILKWLKEERNSCPVCRYELNGEDCLIKKILDLEKIYLLNQTNLNGIIN